MFVSCVGIVRALCIKNVILGTQISSFWLSFLISWEVVKTDTSPSAHRFPGRAMGLGHHVGQQGSSFSFPLGMMVFSNHN